MLKIYFFLAQAPDVTDIESLRKTAKPGGSPLANMELLVLLGSVLILAAVLFIWAFFIRKRPKHARGALVVTRARKGDKADPDQGRRRRRRRADHPDNWKRNPTLGETGGLPPVRQESEENAAESDADGPGDTDRHPAQPR